MAIKEEEEEKETPNVLTASAVSSGSDTVDHDCGGVVAAAAATTINMTRIAVTAAQKEVGHEAESVPNPLAAIDTIHLKQ